MTRRRLYNATKLVIAIYAVALVAAFIFKFTLPKEFYETYKDVLPLVIAMPAAYLAFCFQKRNTYMQALRSLWTQIIMAVQLGFRYTYITKPTEEQYTETLSKLSVAIDEVRGVFCNIDEEKDGVGLYPFEPLKEIHDKITKLGFGKDDELELQKKARSEINEKWKELRAKFLLEFDRDVPTYPSSKYLFLHKEIHSEKVYGFNFDAEMRCEHSHSPSDIIAMKLKCCKKWFPCYQCHEAVTNHSAEVWKLSDYEEKAILCFVCGHQLTISEYMNCNNSCPNCHANFNPNCAKHYDHYFEM